MKLFYAYLADYESHREIAICDNLELAKQRCQEFYTERKVRTRETFSYAYMKRINDKIYLPQKLKWTLEKRGYAPFTEYWEADFPCEGGFRIREVELNELLA